MMVYFYQAECGDAARISFLGNDGKRHEVFIDSGYERTFRHVLKKAIVAAGFIDLWVITHIHDDHIGGSIAYINSLRSGEVNVPVKQWFFNSPRKVNPKFSSSKSNLLSVSSIKSIGQGDKLTDFLTSASRSPLSDITDALGTKDFFGLKISILGPSQSKLDALRAKYGHERSLERQEHYEISTSKAAHANDYKIKIGEFDLSKWYEDKNVDNGSSLSLLTELNGQRILWMADAHPSDIANALSKMGYSPDNPLICDIVKVSHHGSESNNSDELYDILRCRNFVFSVNGENKHHLPNKSALARILRNKYRDIEKDAYKFIFTYDNATLREIFSVDDKTVFDEFNFSCVYSKESYLCFDA